MREPDLSGPVFNGVAAPYTISSNPPNPKTSFRVGDWICTAASCAAHNFGRNSVCIGCGRHRYEGPQPMMVPLSPSYTSPPMNRVSPRFSSGTHDDIFNIQAVPPPSHRSRTQSSPGSLTSHVPSVLQGSFTGHASTSPYPILTPSGRALSVGGRVQNISTEPLAPCIMYWPDNEPLPEQGQIRPMSSAVITYPPIINTGNKGAAEKQPGDWICQKCHYLNWRRRKVCQTCFPYAEGNGDSISATVQAERIALLESVLASQVDRSRVQESWQPVDRTQGMLPAVGPGPLLSPVSPLSPSSLWQTNNHRDAPLVPDRQLFYQTDGDARYLAPLSSGQAPATPTASLLPSFLHDIIQSPSLSPSTSTSSAELSLEEYEDSALRVRARTNGLSVHKRSSASAPSFAIHGHSIWKMDGEESKTLSTTTTTPAGLRQ